MSRLDYQFLAQDLQNKMYNIEKRNPNFQNSKKWQKYKRQEEMLYKKLKELQQGESENERNC